MYIILLITDHIVILVYDINRALCLQSTLPSYATKAWAGTKWVVSRAHNYNAQS